MKGTRIRPLQARRQRRIERRRHEIVTAAAQVFAEKGYANTTTKELAEAADMAEGTLYNYFDGKREILLEIIKELQNPIDELLQNAHGLQSRADFVRIVEQGLDIFISQLDFTRTLFTEVWTDDVILEDFVTGRLQYIGEAIRNFVEQGIAAGTFQPIDTDITTRMVLGSFLALVFPILRGTQTLPSSQQRHKMAKAAIDLLFDGIRVREVKSENT